MSNVPAVIPTGGDLSNFLAKKEKLTGNITGIVLAIIFGVIFLAIFGPWIGGFFTMLNHTFNAIAVFFFKVALVGGGILFFMNKGVRAWLWNLRVAFSRAVTQMFIKVMPTYLLEAYADEYMVGEHGKFIADMSFIKGLKNDATARKTKNRDERSELFDRAQHLADKSYIAAEKRWTNEEDEMNYNLCSQKIGMLDKLFKKLENQEQRLIVMCKIIEKFERAFRYQIAMIKALVESLITEYESEKSMAQATQRMGALTGANAHRQIFDRTKTYVEQQISQFKACTDTFIQIAPELLSEPEIENEMAAARVMEEIQGWDKRIDSVLTQVKDSTDRISQGSVIDMIMTSPTTAEPIPVPVARKDAKKYSGI